MKECSGPSQRGIRHLQLVYTDLSFGRVDASIPDFVTHDSTTEPCFDCGAEVWVSKTTRKVMEEQKEQHGREHRFLCPECSVVRHKKLMAEDEDINVIPNPNFGSYRNN